MKKILFFGAVLIMVCAFIFPIVWIYITALKSPKDIFSENPFVFSPTLENFKYLLYVRPVLGEILNSIILSVTSTFVVIVISVPAAYSFARFRTGGGHILFITISTRMFPGVVAAIPFFLLYRTIGFLDTHIGLMLLYVYFNMSFATFLLYGFFKEIPESLEKAAMIDGYDRLTILRKIVFPLIKPGVAITAMFCLIWSWNEFLFAFLFTRRIARTVSVSQSTFWGSVEIQWGPMAALMAIAIIPTLLSAWIMQKHVVRGLTFGAVKG